MQNEAIWTIGELARMADVTPRTIRYYTAEGLLPPPLARGKYATYSRDHLHRLRLIARLKGAYLPLNEIKARLDQLAPDEIERLLAVDTAIAPASTSSASEYIGRVLRDQQVPPAPRPPLRLPLGYKAAPPAGAIMYAGEASPVEQAESDTPAGRDLAEAPAPPYQPTPFDPGHVELPSPAERASLLRRLVPRRSHGLPDSPAMPGSVQGETWRRVALARGIELHLQEPTSPDMEERVARLLALAREMFADEI